MTALHSWKWTHKCFDFFSERLRSSRILSARASLSSFESRLTWPSPKSSSRSSPVGNSSSSIRSLWDSRELRRSGWKDRRTSISSASWNKVIEFTHPEFGGKFLLYFFRKLLLSLTCVGISLSSFRWLEYIYFTSEISQWLFFPNSMIRFNVWITGTQF